MKTNCILFTLALVFFGAIYQSAAQGTTAFTYQGQLRDNGTNANGVYTMIFALYDSASGGNEIGTTVTSTPTLANGLFTVNLNFGANAFLNGNGFPRWLDITVTNGGMAQTLSPRVQVLPAPYAQFSTAAGTVAATEETLIGTNVVSSDTWNIGPVLNTSHALVFSDNGTTQMSLNTNGQGAVFAGNVYAGGTFFGDGSGLTNLRIPLPNVSVFNTDGTFLVPTNVTRIMVEMWGAGGGGGSSVQDMNYVGGFGGGGGSGGYVWSILPVTPGSNYIVTVGVSVGGSDGTPTSFGDLLTASGGSAGLSATLNSYGDYYGAGGLGGAGKGGLINVTGGNGADGEDNITGTVIGSAGGSVWRGGLGGTGPGTYPANGGPGVGGSSGGWLPLPGSSLPGYKGSDGLVIITY